MYSFSCRFLRQLRFRLAHKSRESLISETQCRCAKHLLTVINLVVPAVVVAVPSLKWLGVRSADLYARELSEECLQPFKPRDVTLVNTLLSSPIVQVCPRLALVGLAFYTHPVCLGRISRRLAAARKCDCMFCGFCFWGISAGA